MIAKEKALDLISSFEWELQTHQNYEAKQCVLICVDEIIEEVREFCDDNFIQDRLNYWSEVKQEIKKINMK